MTSGPSGFLGVTLRKEGSGQIFLMITVKKASGKEAGRNNRNLAQQETPVECSEMGTIRNDGSHLCL